MKKIHLVIIDGQVDFCDPNIGSLYVNGADQDMIRLSKFIDKYGEKIDDISATLDSHHLLHIAHPMFWVNSQGQNPQPFTIITHDDLKNGVWSTARPSWMRRFPYLSQGEPDFGAMDYVASLEKNGKYPLCVWPPHCLIGSVGHSVFQPLYESLVRWEKDQFGAVHYVTKGSNHFTEHYSAICADVPVSKDHTTQMNTDFLNTVMTADVILLAGEAGSHCLANTGRDADKYFHDSSFVKKLVLLEDATSPVPGFENLQADFIKDMTAKGMQVAKTTDYF